MEGFSVLPHVCMILRRSKGNPYTAGVVEEKEGMESHQPTSLHPSGLELLQCSNQSMLSCGPKSIVQEFEAVCGQ